MNRLLSLSCLMLTITACGGPETSKKDGKGDTPAATQKASEQKKASEGSAQQDTLKGADTPAKMVKEKPSQPPPDPLRPRDDLPPEERAVIVVDGKRRVVEASAAVAAGYTLVDFRNDWTPYIFVDQEDEEGVLQVHRYRSVFLGLANDTGDADGQPLEPGEHNYLEPYGIPPSFGVVRKRFVKDEESKCMATVDFDLLKQTDAIYEPNGRRDRRRRRKAAKLEKKLLKLKKEAGVDTWEALIEANPESAENVRLYTSNAVNRKAFQQAELRLKCEGMLPKRYKHKRGKWDRGFKLGLKKFQQKHMLYEYPALKAETMQRMAMNPAEGNFLSFERALTERVVAATGILEDGSVHVGKKKRTYKTPDGETHEVPNLVADFTAAAKQQIGVETPEQLAELFEQYSDQDLQWLRFGVKFPEKPPYYSEHMDLHMFIDRGDVTYDPPWDENDKWSYPSRKRKPKLWLHVKWEGQKIPLARWPSTIGGWRAEQAKNGYEYYKYKKSEVGPRVMRKVVAGPAWIPPVTTPIRGLVRRKWINGKGSGIVNYSETGPGYESAYGLVAGYFVMPGRNGKADWDQGIRAHGSSDYMSIYSRRGYSHGCHRLLNHLAVRLYGFILQHRHMKVKGEQMVNYHRQFLKGEEVYEMRIPSRGYRYILEPPMPIMVNEGNIVGRHKKPIEGLVPKPNTLYPADEEEGDAESGETGALPQIEKGKAG
ncbi:MAG: hypothetical protein ACE366_12055 [Bradymonadia bacterium]